MGIKIPGLLKSTAFQTGFMQNVNTRFDKMRENSEAFQTAARKKGQELFKSHKATTDTLKTVNKAKMYISSQFSPELADYMDSTGALEFTTGMDTKNFLEQVDAEAMKIQSSGGVPKDFEISENPYYGDERYQKYETSYNQVKDFMDKNNNVFGNSFEALMEENSPTLMSKEDFGVTSRDDIASLNRTGLGGSEVDAMDENRLIKQVNTQGGWTSGILKPDNAGGFYVDITDSTEKFAASVANQFASQHYRFNTDRSQTGLGFSARQGINTSKAIMGFASKTDTFESALQDSANIIDMVMQNIPGVASNSAELQNIIVSSSNLYMMALQKTTGNKAMVAKLRRELENIYGITIPPMTGFGTSNNSYVG